MTDIKISQLPAAGAAADAQEFEINDSGTSRKITFQKIREKLKSVFDGAYATKTHDHTAAQISDATAVGRNVLKAADAAAARAAIGAGTGNSNLQLGTTATTAKAGNWQPNISTETTGMLPYARVSSVPDTAKRWPKWSEVTEKPAGAGGLPDALGVGSYVLARLTSGSTALGSTAQGSQLKGVAIYRLLNDQYSSLWAPTNTPYMPAALAGTWRNMGPNTAAYAGQGGDDAPFYYINLWMRIA